MSEAEVTTDSTVEGECPAVEVFRLKYPDGHFSASMEQRRYYNTVQFQLYRTQIM